MKPRTGVPGLLMALLLSPAGAAQDSALEQGAALYQKECMICHGSAAREDGARATAPWQQRWLYAAARQHAAPETRVDIPAGDISAASGNDSTPMQLAFSPPYGPTLRGVYGRLAGSVEGFTYSNTFQKTLKGMEWNEATLDVYITDTQAWVPGIYMFYKQKNADIRHKIIAYLKANQ